MKLRLIFCVFFAVMGILSVKYANADNVITTKPVYVPDLSHENDHLDLTNMTWEKTMITTNVPADTARAHVVFSFTNVSSNTITIADVHGSCSCTTPELPPLPWRIPAGSSGQIGANVNLAGKFGTVVKSVHVGTDKGSRDLYIQISIQAPVIPVLTDADRVRQM